MKNKLTKFLVAFIVVCGFIACDNEDSGAEALANLPLVEVSIGGYTDLLTENLNAVLGTKSASVELSEKEGLLLMREEELFAHDVYNLFSGLYDLRIFSNITRSEATHAEAILSLLNFFEIEDPAIGIEGEYKDETLQALYDELIEKGKVSIEEALKVGAYIEEVDIKDLAELMAETDNEDIFLVYDNLMRGSRNHLRAFNRVLESYSVDYLPSVLSEEDFNEITSSDMERGNGCQAEVQNKYQNQNQKGRRYRGGN